MQLPTRPAAPARAPGCGRQRTAEEERAELWRGSLRLLNSLTDDDALIPWHKARLTPPPVTRLAIAFAERETAKQHGARLDGELRTWVIRSRVQRAAGLHLDGQAAAHAVECGSGHAVDDVRERDSCAYLLGDGKRAEDGRYVWRACHTGQVPIHSEIGLCLAFAC